MVGHRQLGAAHGRHNNLLGYSTPLLRGIERVGCYVYWKSERRMVQDGAGVLARKMNIFAQLGAKRDLGRLLKGRMGVGLAINDGATRFMVELKNDGAFEATKSPQ